MTYNEINQKYLSFVNQMLFLRLVNSGKSSASDKQSELVKNAFSAAYEIMLAAKAKQNTELFNRVYRMAQELVPSAEMIAFMKHPEMYNEMQSAYYSFNSDVADLLRRNPSFQVNMRERGN